MCVRVCMSTCALMWTRVLPITTEPDLEISHVARIETLHKILLDAAACRNDGVDLTEGESKGGREAGRQVDREIWRARE